MAEKFKSGDIDININPNINDALVKEEGAKMGKVMGSEMVKEIRNSIQNMENIPFTFSTKEWSDPKTGKSGSYPVVSSPLFTGMTRANGRGYIEPGEQISVNQLMQMFQYNSKGASKYNPQEVIREFFNYLKNELKDASLSAQDYQRIIGGQQYYKNVASSTIADYVGDSAGWFINSLYKKTTGGMNQIQGVSSETWFSLKASVEGLKESLRDVYEDLRETATDIYFSEREREPISAVRQRQSDYDKKYSGYNNPDYETEYEQDLQRLYENQAKRAGEIEGKQKAFSEFLEDIRSNTKILPDKSSVAGEESISNILSQVVRFLTQGYLSEEIEGYEEGMVDENQLNILQDMKKLSSLVMNDDNLKNYFAFDRKSKDEINTLSQDFPNFLQKLNDVLYEFVNKSYQDTSGVELMPEVRKQITYKLIGLNKVLGSFDKANQISGDTLQNYSQLVIDSFWNELQEHVIKFTNEEGKNVEIGPYDANARRSFFSKQGIEQEGRYPVADIPQYLLSSMPFFPSKDEDGNIKDASDYIVIWADKFAEYSEKAAEEIVDKGELSSETAKKLETAQKNLQTIYSGIKNIQEIKQINEILSSDYGIAPTAEGQLKMETDFTPEDYYKIIEEYEKGIDVLSNKQLIQRINRLGKLVNDLNIANIKREQFNEGDYDVQEAQEELKALETLLAYMKKKKKNNMSVEDVSYLQGSRIEFDAINLDNLATTLIEGGDPDNENDWGISLRDVQDRINDILEYYLPNNFKGIQEQALKAIATLEEQYYQNKLFPYIEQYLKGDTKDRRKITLDLKEKYGEDSEIYQYYVTNRQNLLKKMSELLDQREKDETIISDMAERSGLNTSSSSQDLAVGNKYLENIKKQYSTGGKVYSGPGFNFEGQDMFISDIEKMYDKVGIAAKERILGELKQLYDTLTSDQQQWFLAELGREKPYRTEALNRDFWNEYASTGLDEQGVLANQNLQYNTSTYRWEKVPEELKKVAQAQTEVKQATEATTEAIIEQNNKIDSVNTSEVTDASQYQQEESAVESLNADLIDHAQKVENAVNAESSKIVVSKELATQLAKEENVVNQVGDAYQQAEQQGQQLADTAKRVSGAVTDIRGFIPKFDSNKHSYSDPESGDEFWSVTQLRDALLRAKNPTFATDMERIKEQATENFKKGAGAVTADDVGMSEKDFKFMVEDVLAQGIRGDAFHSLIDKMVKSNSTSLEELEKNDNKAFKEYQEEYKNAVEELSKYGIGEEFLNIQERLEAYMDAYRKSGMSMTKFSEQRLAMELSGTRGSIKVGVTPDQLFSMGGQGAIVDSKTGNVKGYESFQLTAQKLATLANLDNEIEVMLEDGQKALVKIRDVIGDVDPNKDFKLYIADIQDGMVQLDEYISLSANEFYNLAMDAKDILDNNGSPLSKEEINRRMNRQLKSGHIVGYSDSKYAESVNEELMFIDADQGKVIREYLSYLKQINDVQLKIVQVQNEMETADENRKRNLQDLLNSYNKQLETLKTNQPQLESFVGSEGLQYRLGQNLLDSDHADYLKKKLDEVNNAFESKSIKSINKIKENLDKLTAKDTPINTGLFGEDFDTIVQKLKDGYTEIDRTQESLSAKVKAYEASLRSEVSALKDIATHSTKIQSINEQIDKLQADNSTENSELLNDLNKRLKKEQELLKVAEQRRDVAIQERQGTGLDEDIASGKVDAKTKQGIANIYSQQRQNLVNAVNQGTAKAEADQSVQNYVQANKLIKEYINNLKLQYKTQQEIQKLSIKMENQSGNELAASEAYKAALESRVDSLQEQLPYYDQQSKKLGNIKLEEEQIVSLEKQKNNLAKQQQIAQEKINATVKDQRNILEEIVGGFKQAFRNMTDASIAYEIIGMFRQGVTELLQTIREMDSALVDLQIASGGTREEMHDMMMDLNSLATEVGKTTTEVAQGANDWLRAGYEGQEAADLTRASMQLSTLGMIDSADATSYLISVLKGWKLEAEEVSSVVDKLVAVDGKMSFLSRNIKLKSLEMLEVPEVYFTKFGIEKYGDMC